MKYTIDIDGKSYELDEKSLDDVALSSINANEFNIIEDNASKNVKILCVNGREVTVEVDGYPFTCVLKDEKDALVHKMGLSVVSTQKLSSIKAPMPGLILDIMVTAGDTLKEGTPILILEAMKMENVLKATGEGVIKSIEVVNGDAVDKGQVLIEME